MASLTITINTPALTSGQYFKERHRQLPAGAWSSVTNRSNAAFTLTGITPGDYQFEFILVKADATECQSKYYSYTVTETQEFECIDFTVVQLTNPDRLKITYTLPVGYTPPACGYTVGCRIGNTGGFASTRYTTLPASPFYIPLPFGGMDLDVRITADQCEAAKICFDDDVPKPEIPPCQVLMNNAGLIPGPATFVRWTAPGLARCRIRLVFDQSVPPCLSIAVLVQQVYYTGGTPAVYHNTAYIITAASTYIDVELDFQAKNTQKVWWEASITDCCDHNLYYSGDINVG